MECRQQPVSALMLLFFLEVKAYLSYPQFILAFPNLKNNYWFFFFFEANKWKYVTFQEWQGLRGTFW